MPYFLVFHPCSFFDNFSLHPGKIPPTFCPHLFNFCLITLFYPGYPERIAFFTPPLHVPFLAV